ncbi:MAG: amidohydrolase family protein [Betaproteobacteria bacterium]
MHDLIIENATIYDGLGAAPRRGSVAVNGDRIAEVGEVNGEARERIDARGLALMPGIIDTHTHYDAQITWDPFASPSPALGVTTVVMGNCGFTIAPCRPADRDLVMRNLTHVEGMSLDALRTGTDWDFESFPQYLDMLERKGVGPNAAVFVGHSSVRTFVMREDATKRTATDDEIAQMRAIVKEAMQVGAVGFSTTRNGQHNGEAGVPMPSRLADENELMSLSTALKDAGRGVLMMTKDSATTTMSSIEAIARESGRPYIVAALLHSNETPEATFEDLEAIGGARRRGGKLYGAVSPCPLNFEFTMHEPYVFEGLASWRPVMEAKEADVPRILASKQFRDKVKQELSVPARRMFNGQWQQMYVAQTAKPENRHLESRSVEELAGEKGQHPFDFALDLALEENLDTLFTATLLNSDDDAVGRMMLDPNSMISLSDAGAHLTFLCDAGFGLHLLGHWVRERKLMPLQEAIRKITSEPARIFGIRERGSIKPGMHADLFLFDPLTVGRKRAERVFDLPAGASRLTTPAIGVHGVWINGKKIADAQGIRADAQKAGKVLRDFAS